MGGDNAPHSNIDGAVKFLDSHKDVKLYFVGDESVIQSELSKINNLNSIPEFLKKIANDNTRNIIIIDKLT